MKQYFEQVMLLVVSLYFCSFGEINADNFSTELNRNVKAKPLYLVNIGLPKSGNHLFKKCISYLKNKKVKDSVHPKPADTAVKCKYMNQQMFIDEQDPFFLGKFRKKIKRFGQNFSFHLA